MLAAACCAPRRPSWAPRPRLPPRGRPRPPCSAAHWATRAAAFGGVRLRRVGARYVRRARRPTPRRRPPRQLRSGRGVRLCGYEASVQIDSARKAADSKAATGPVTQQPGSSSRLKQTGAPGKPGHDSWELGRTDSSAAAASATGGTDRADYTAALMGGSRRLDCSPRHRRSSGAAGVAAAWEAAGAPRFATRDSICHRA